MNRECGHCSSLLCAARRKFVENNNRRQCCENLSSLDKASSLHLYEYSVQVVRLALLILTPWFKDVWLLTFFDIVVIGIFRRLLLNNKDLLLQH